MIWQFRNKLKLYNKHFFFHSYFFCNFNFIKNGKLKSIPESFSKKKKEDIPLKTIYLQLSAIAIVILNRPINTFQFTNVPTL